jgi:hypothetical protein
MEVGVLDGTTHPIDNVSVDVLAEYIGGFE